MFKNEWISVKDRLPEVPVGSKAVHVIVAEYDHCEPGYIVHSVMYGTCPQSKYFESYVGFMQLYGGADMFWGILHDQVTHWMYMPEPPVLSHDIF